MSKLVIQHRAIEARIKSLQSELKAIESRPEYSEEQEFAEKLDKLLAEYGKDLKDIWAIFDPDTSVDYGKKPPRGPAPGTPRKRVKYKNPHTGEVIETASGNHRILKLWKTMYPGTNLKDWIVSGE